LKNKKVFWKFFVEKAPWGAGGILGKVGRHVEREERERER